MMNTSSIITTPSNTQNNKSSFLALVDYFTRIKEEEKIQKIKEKKVNKNVQEWYKFEKRFSKLNENLKKLKVFMRTGEFLVYKEICNHISRNCKKLYGSMFANKISELRNEGLLVSIISDKELAAKTGLKKCTIRKYKVKLRNLGVLIQIKPHFHSDVNLYVVGFKENTFRAKYEKLFLGEILYNKLSFDFAKEETMFVVNEKVSIIYIAQFIKHTIEKHKIETYTEFTVNNDFIKILKGEEEVSKINKTSDKNKKIQKQKTEDNHKDPEKDTEKDTENFYLNQNHIKSEKNLTLKQEENHVADIQITHSEKGGNKVCTDKSIVKCEFISNEMLNFKFKMKALVDRLIILEEDLIRFKGEVNSKLNLGAS